MDHEDVVNLAFVMVEFGNAKGTRSEITIWLIS
jgi:hypothetical protein